MLRTIPIALLCSLFLLSPSRAQEVYVPRQLRKLPVIKPDTDQNKSQPLQPAPAKQAVSVNQNETARRGSVQVVIAPESPANSELTQVEPAKTVATKRPAAKPLPEKKSRPEIEKKVVSKEPVNEESSEKISTERGEVKKARSGEGVAVAKVQIPKVESTLPTSMREPEVSLATQKAPSTKLESRALPTQESTATITVLNGSNETAATKLADGFDFPVGKPDAEGYYKARGYRSGGHMGEDWDGIRGGDTDLGDPIYSIGDGIVVFARDVRLGWGNVVIVRHAFREEGTIKHIDSLYGHLQKILVKRGQRVVRGQEIGTMGTAHGQYDAHLHLEIRKNIEIGMSKSKFQKNLSNYYDPSQFITSHRRLSGGGASFRVAMNTFTHDAAFHFDRNPNYGPRKRSTTQSAAALRRALSNASSTERD